jgi:integrase/recombinase XerD
MINKDYLSAFNQFKKINNLNDEVIKKTETNQLRDIIDITFNQNYKGAVKTKLFKITAVKNYIKEYFNIELPESKIRKGLNRLKLNKTDKEKLTKDEVHNILQYCIKQNKESSNKFIAYRNYLLLSLLIKTGQRINDLLSLKVKDIKQQSIFIKQEKTGVEVILENPLNQKDLNSFLTFYNIADTDYLFFADSFNKNKLSYQQANQIIKKIGYKTIKKEISCHIFRVYFISQLLESGLTPQAIQTLSGHSSTLMIDYYNKSKPKTNGYLEKL